MVTKRDPKRAEIIFRGEEAQLTQHDFIARVRLVLDLSPETQLQLTRVTRAPKGGHSVEYAIARPVVLEGREFGMAEGVTVDEQGAATLRFDANGRLVSSKVHPSEERQLRLVRDQVRKLAQADQIALDRRAPAQGAPKPWYIEVNADGTRRLRRARMA